MRAHLESIINSLAALVVLFTAMLDPRISVVLAVVLLLALALLKLRCGASPNQPAQRKAD